MSASALKIVRFQEFARWPTPAKSTPAEGLHPHATHCLVFRQANALGWYVYPPFDATVTWKGGSSFDVVTEDELGERLWRQVMGELIGRQSSWWCSKLEGIFQLDPGLIYVTEPGRKVLLTPALNRPNPSFWTQAGLLDADWFWVPSTINLQITRQGETFRLRRDEPIAQIVVLDADLSQEKQFVSADITEAPEARQLWLDYMADKYGAPVSQWGEELPEPKLGVYARWKKRIEAHMAGSKPQEPPK
jgi:hypothetical protein